MLKPQKGGRGMIVYVPSQSINYNFAHISIDMSTIS